jgi:1-acyl-sn-glycerol-3-phosphate acyltransferase
MGMVEAAYLVSVFGASVVTTSENSKLPLLGSIIKALRCVIVDRAVGSGLDAIKARALTPNSQLLIFPEGK